MQKESMKEYIARYRKEYNKIVQIKCSALSSSVKFSSVGFKHLIFKGSHRRTNRVIKNRLKLIPLAVPVLKNSFEITETRIKKETHYGAVKEVKYEALEAVVSKSRVRVRVVVRTIGKSGQLQFYSIMKY